MNISARHRGGINNARNVTARAPRAVRNNVSRVADRAARRNVTGQNNVALCSSRRALNKRITPSIFLHRAYRAYRNHVAASSSRIAVLKTVYLHQNNNASFRISTHRG